MKRTIAVTITALLIIGFSSTSATAGAARRHTIEGIMIGTSVALLGAAIYNEIHNDHPRAVVHHRDRCHTPRHHHQDRHWDKNRHANNKRHHKKYKAGRRGGYWEVERVWVGPVYKKRWNPGHYNRRGKWVAGRHKRIMVKDGYYTKKKVWIRN